MKTFSCKIKINEPNRNGVMYTKDSFKQDSYELPICIGDDDYIIGKATMNIEDEWIKIKGEVADETFPDIFHLPEISYSFSSIGVELDKQTVLKCVPEHIGVLNKDINAFSVVEID